MMTASFDLETTNLNGNFGVILCACIKPFKTGKVITFRGDSYPHWKDKRSDDSAICRDIYRELQEYDIWVAHNGVKFDIPFLRTRLMKAGLRMAQPKVVDPVMIARRFLKLGYNSLEQVAGHFGVVGKTRVDADHWMRAALDGNRTSMNYIVKHCVADVVILERVLDKVRYLVPKIDVSGSDR